MEFITAISDAFLKGGTWMWVILGMQLTTVAIIAERYIYLYRKNSIGDRKHVNKFEALIRAGRLDEVKSEASKQERPVDQVVIAGVEAAMNWGGKDEIRGKMDEVLLDTNSKYEERIGFLAMLGNVATLTGLLGTIAGMIKSFTAVSSASPMEKAALLSNGISEAMFTTAYGLIVAIPALIIYAIYLNHSTKLSEDLNQASLKVFNWLSYAYEPAERAIEMETPKKSASHKAKSVDL
jgi:biopolymer transport protein ExbB